MFNLVDSPWIPVVFEDGAQQRLSLRDTLRRSRHVSRLDVPLETMIPALLRQVLLPVALRAMVLREQATGQDGPPKDETEWATRFHAGPENSGLTAAVDDYLSRFRARFDLFDSARPFAQAAAGKLPAPDGPGGLTKLVTTLATGNNVPLFTSQVQGQPFTMEPADAALWLLHTLCWDTGGAKPSPKDGVGVGPLGSLGVVIPEGRDLYETLMLNLPILGGGVEPDDLPHWELPSRAFSGRVKTEPRPGHLMRLFTLQSRSIRLIPDDASDPRRVIGALVYPGVEYTETPVFEPHTVWTWKGKGAQGRNVPTRHPYDHGTWWGLQSLLALPSDLASRPGSSRLAGQLRMAGELAVEEHLPTDFPLQVGVYGAKYTSPPGRCEDIVHDRIPLPVAALITEDRWPERNAVATAAAQIHAMAEALDRAWNQLRKAAGRRDGGRGRDRQGIDPIDLLLDRVDPLARRFFRTLQQTRGDQNAVRESRRHWERGLRREALDVFEELLAIVGPRAVAGRTLTEEINGQRKDIEYTAARAESAIWAQAKTSLPLHWDHTEGIDD